jgi:hypothetical protein
MVNHFGSLTISGEQFDYMKAWEEDKQFENKTVKDIMTYPLSRKNPFHPVSTNTNTNTKKNTTKTKHNTYTNNKKTD